MKKKIYTAPSMNVSLFEAENVVTVSGVYETSEDAIRGGAFKIDNGHSSEAVQAIFTF